LSLLHIFIENPITGWIEYKNQEYSVSQCVSFIHPKIPCKGAVRSNRIFLFSALCIERAIFLRISSNNWSLLFHTLFFLIHLCRPSEYTFDRRHCRLFCMTLQQGSQARLMLVMLKSTERTAPRFIRLVARLPAAALTSHTPHISEHCL